VTRDGDGLTSCARPDAALAADEDEVIGISGFNMSFFVTSAGPDKGADLGGLAVRCALSAAGDDGRCERRGSNPAGAGGPRQGVSGASGRGDHATRSLGRHDLST
jgi:hypothetical protein